MFFPRNSFVTNTTLTHTDTPRVQNPEAAIGTDHIACHGGDPQAAQAAWSKSSGQGLVACLSPCLNCGTRCQGNGGVSQDPPVNGHVDIHMYTYSITYVNQDLECQVTSGQSAFVGVYLKDGGELGIMS